MPSFCCQKSRMFLSSERNRNSWNKSKRGCTAFQQKLNIHVVISQTLRMFTHITEPTVVDLNVHKMQIQASCVINVMKGTLIECKNGSHGEKRIKKTYFSLTLLRNPLTEDSILQNACVFLFCPKPATLLGQTDFQKWG